MISTFPLFLSLVQIYASTQIEWMIDVNECESNTSSALGPCINAESCTNTPGAFTCTCLEGWSGLTCAKDIDDCVGQCENGATCIDLVNDYHCACANGFTGMHQVTNDKYACTTHSCRIASTLFCSLLFSSHSLLNWIFFSHHFRCNSNFWLASVDKRICSK